VILKENPKQTHVRRPALFYQRIARLNSVVWASDAIDTAQLLGRSTLAATHCGTVGWESLAVGRSFVYFGDPWYAGLPGATKWSEGLKLAELASRRVVREDLDAAANELLSKAADGLIYMRQAVLLPDGIDRASAAAITSRSLVTISRAADEASGEGN
jgi:capsule polysaccharide export protein KpsC/LpsZ